MIDINYPSYKVYADLTKIFDSIILALQGLFLWKFALLTVDLFL